MRTFGEVVSNPLPYGDYEYFCNVFLLPGGGAIVQGIFLDKHEQVMNEVDSMLPKVKSIATYGFVDDDTPHLLKITERKLS